MNAPELIGLLVLGASAALDRTAFGQTLLAHPMIAACLAGTIVGDPFAGALAGLFVTVLSAPVVPVGERGLRDWTSVAVVLGALVAATDDAPHRGAALLLVVVGARPAGRGIEALRTHVTRVVRRRTARPAAQWLDGLEREHLALASLHLVHGALVTAIGLALGLFLLEPVVDALPSAERTALGLLWRLAPLAGLPLLLRFHAGAAGLWRWVAVGTFAGLLVMAASRSGGLTRLVVELS